MNIRQLRYFISVAEHLSFTKAAKQHFIAQTGISQQIIALEKQLGVNLFIRNNRSVQLTSAGTAFLREAKIMVAMAEEAIKKTHHAASGFVGNLKIGFLGPNEKKFLPDLIRKFRHKHPNINLSFVQDNPEALKNALQTGLLDIAFSVSHNIGGTPDIEWKTICSNPICVVLPRTHLLASEMKINLASLAHEPFILIESQEYLGVFERMIDFCIKKGGFSPTIVSQHRYPETLLLLVEAGIGIALLPNFLDYSNPNIQFVEIEGEDDWIHSGIAWHKNITNPSVSLFLSELNIVMTEERMG